MLFWASAINVSSMSILVRIGDLKTMCTVLHIHIEAPAITRRGRHPSGEQKQLHGTRLSAMPDTALIAAARI
jgi:hypothetical protein